MKSHRLFPLLLFAFAFPCDGQVQPQARGGSLLQAVSEALDHYEQLAPSIQCEDATDKTLRDSCKSVLELLAGRPNAVTVQVRISAAASACTPRGRSVRPASS